MSNYDALNHLSRALFLKRTQTMAMLTIYCDDSGTDAASPVAVVAGYISNVAQWELFSKEWGDVLKEFRINRMRRADLENFRGEFKNWQPERRTAFVKRLQHIIKKRTKTPIASIVIKEDFERFIHDPLKQWAGGMYGFLAYTCLVGVGEWCHKPSRNHCDPIQWVFECGTEGSSQVAQMFQATYADEEYRKISRLGGWSFSGKDVTPLQAADLLAYECFKFASNRIVDRSQQRPLRASWLGLFEDERLPYVKLLDKQSLEFFAARWEKHGFTDEDYMRRPLP